MHITFIALGSMGDILPYLALGGSLKTCRSRGAFHHLREFFFIGGRAGPGFLSHSRRCSIPGQSGRGQYAVSGSYFRLPWVTAMLEDLSDPKLLETDLFVNQLPVGLFGHDLAEKAGVIMFQAAVMPLTRTHYFPLLGSPRDTIAWL